MDHGYFEDRISAYRDKGLPADEYEMIRRHLDECVSCRNLYDRLEKFDRLVRDNAELGDDLYWERAAQKIEQRLGIAETVVTPVAKKGAWSGLGWKMAAAAASVVLIFIIAINKDKIFNEEQMIAPGTGSPSPTMTDSFKSKELSAPSQSYRDTATASPQSVPAITDEIDGEATADNAPAEEGRMRKVETVEKKTAPALPRRKTVLQTPALQPPVSPTNEVQQSEQAGTEPAEVQKSAPSPSLSMGLQEDNLIDTQSKQTPEAKTEIASRSTRPEMVASESAAVDTVNKVRIAELESWRAVRDSLEPMLATTKTKNQFFDAMAPTSLQKDQRSKPRRTAADVMAELEVQYLEACYQIARLTSEPSEIKSAKDRLQKVAGDPKSPNRDTAQVFLDRLAAGN